MLKKSLLLSMFLGFMMFFTHSASASYTAHAGDLLRTVYDPTVVLVMDDGSRVPISSDAYAVRYNNNFSLIKTVTDAERGSYNSNAVSINSMTSLPQGTVFMYNINQPGIYLVDNGYKRLFSSLTGFLAAGYSLDSVEWAGDYTLYPTGSSVQ